MKKLLLIIAGFVLVLKSDLIAQTKFDQAFSLSFKALPNPASKYDSLTQITCNLQIADTVNTEKITIKVGTANGLSDVFNKDFYTKAPNVLPSGITYKRDKAKVTIVLGTYKYRDFFYDISMVNKTGALLKNLKYNKGK